MPKAIVPENEESEEATPTTPRQSGSMVTHQDDVVTRMKNIEMIELGRHRIKPWYFAPYPQVSKMVVIEMRFDSVGWLVGQGLVGSKPAQSFFCWMGLGSATPKPHSIVGLSVLVGFIDD